MKFYLLITICIQLWSSQAYSLPIGFGRNQDNLEYQEISNKDFLIYHDKRTPNEAKLALDSLNQAKTSLTNWFEVKSDKQLTIITSAATSHASFANLITNNLEVQTLGQGSRDLFWHEYVHNMMYHHFFNIFGPAGSVFHLPWMSNWWIEGLAEALSQSTGSDLQAISERMAALENQWPSFASMHSLYRQDSNQMIGYTLSGSFVSYIYRQYKSKNLASFHQDFYHYTMPWYMLWSMIPFNGFMPMDKSLQNMTKKKAIELFDEYKKNSTQHWTKNSPAPLRFSIKSMPKNTVILNTRAKLHKFQNELRTYFFNKNKLTIAPVTFKNPNWASLGSFRSKYEVPSDTLSRPMIIRKNFAPVIVRYVQQFRDEPNYEIWAKTRASADYHHVLNRKASIHEFIETKKNLLWLEQDTEKTQICYIHRMELRKKKVPSQPEINCLQPFTIPNSISYLGTNETAHEKATLAWFKITTQTITGDQYKILKLNLADMSTTILHLNQAAKPIAAHQIHDELWVLNAHRSHHDLRLFSLDGQCQGELPFNESLEAIYSINNKDLIIRMSNLREDTLYKIQNPKNLLKPCNNYGAHTSPLLESMRAGSNLSFSEAFKRADLWSTPKFNEQSNDQALLSKEQMVLLAQANSHEEQLSDTPTPLITTPSAKKSFGLGIKIPETSQETKYRMKHVVTAPWVISDPFGSAIGVLSIPLMEFSQNEEARLGLFWGTTSQYPDIDLSIKSTRYWPTIEWNVYKSIRFNGQFLVTNTTTNEQKIVSSYFDEMGTGINASFSFYPYPWLIKIGYLFKDQKVFDGPEPIPFGQTHEVSLTLNNQFRLGIFGFSTTLYGTSAPEQINKDFIYNKFGADHSISSPFIFGTSLSLGAEYQRTRGSEMPNLKELYRPLKIYVPGEGGGANMFYFEVADYMDIEKGRLFSALYGQNQGRAKVNWTIPIVRNFDRMFWIFYLNRLDLTSFYNIGSAWTKEFPDFEDLQQAHGHSLDFQFEIKGINFSLGLGAGHVYGYNYDYFMSLSFDDIFSV